MDKILGVSLGTGEQWKQTNKKITYWDIKGTVNEESSGTSVLSFYRKCIQTSTIPCFSSFPPPFSSLLVSNLSKCYHWGNLLKIYSTACPFPQCSLHTLHVRYVLLTQSACMCATLSWYCASVKTVPLQQMCVWVYVCTYTCMFVFMYMCTEKV